MARFSSLALAALVVLVACGASPDASKTTTVDALHARLAATGDKPVVVDVREPSEYDAVHIEGAVLAPLAQVEEKLASMKKDQEIALVCRSGRRSGIALEKLSAKGFTNLKNVEGGMLAWEKAGYPVVKKK